MSLVSKDNESTLKQNLVSAQQTVQTQNFTALSRAPLLAEIPDQGQVLAMVSGTLYIYTKYKNDRYRVAFTAAP